MVGIWSQNCPICCPFLKIEQYTNGTKLPPQTSQCYTWRSSVRNGNRLYILGYFPFFSCLSPSDGGPKVENSNCLLWLALHHMYVLCRHVLYRFPSRTAWQLVLGKLILACESTPYGLSDSELKLRTGDGRDKYLLQKPRFTAGMTNLRALSLS